MFKYDLGERVYITHEYVTDSKVIDVERGKQKVGRVIARTESLTGRNRYCISVLDGGNEGTWVSIEEGHVAAFRLSEIVLSADLDAIRSAEHLNVLLSSSAVDKVSPADLYRVVAAVEECNAECEALLMSKETYGEILRIRREMWSNHKSEGCVLFDRRAIKADEVEKKVCGRPVFCSDKLELGEIIGGMWSDLADGKPKPDRGCCFVRLMPQRKSVQFREFL